MSEDLKSLSMETESIKAARAGTDIGPDGQPVDKQSEEIKEIMKRYSDIIGEYVFLILSIYVKTHIFPELWRFNKQYAFINFLPLLKTMIISMLRKKTSEEL